MYFAGGLQGATDPVAYSVAESMSDDSDGKVSLGFGSLLSNILQGLLWVMGEVSILALTLFWRVTKVLVMFVLRWLASFTESTKYAFEQWETKRNANQAAKSMAIDQRNIFQQGAVSTSAAQGQTQGQGQSVAIGGTTAKGNVQALEESEEYKKLKRLLRNTVKTVNSLIAEQKEGEAKHLELDQKVAKVTVEQHAIRSGELTELSNRITQIEQWFQQMMQAQQAAQQAASEAPPQQPTQ